MSKMIERLELCEAILSLIEQHREKTGDPYLGEGIERMLLDSQFTELESDIFENPGAIEPWLIRLRRGEA